MTDKNAVVLDPSSFPTLDGFLEDLGVREDLTIQAIKEVIAVQLERAMASQRMSRKTMAARMHTSPAQIRRVLDPAEGNVTLETLVRAAKVVGRDLRIELI